MELLPNRERNLIQQRALRAYLLYEKSKRPGFGPKTNNESSFAGHIMQTIINICLGKNKSKQSYVWSDSIFEAQSICFGTEIVGLLDFSYNKCVLA